MTVADWRRGGWKPRPVNFRCDNGHEYEYDEAMKARRSCPVCGEFLSRNIDDRYAERRRRIREAHRRDRERAEPDQPLS